MNESTDRIQDHALDESTGVQPQQFDADGYVVGHPHHTTVSGDDLGPDGGLAEADAVPAPPAAGPRAPDAPDGQFDDQRMPTTDGELSHPDPGAGLADQQNRGGTMSNLDGILSTPDETLGVVGADGGFAPLPDPDGSIAPPPGGDPNEPVPGAPDGVPVDPDITPDEPPPFAPDDASQAADPQRTVGGQAF
jgi:hypothetical protein